MNNQGFSYDTENEKYNAVFFKQREKAPIQCSFVASSADIFDWATVPTKTNDNIRNFQRPEIQRNIDSITDFFDKFEENSSPTSIVIGLKKESRIRYLNESGQDLNFDWIDCERNYRNHFFCSTSRNTKETCQILD